MRQSQLVLLWADIRNRNVGGKLETNLRPHTSPPTVGSTSLLEAGASSPHPFKQGQTLAYVIACAFNDEGGEALTSIQLLAQTPVDRPLTVPGRQKLDTDNASGRLKALNDRLRRYTWTQGKHATFRFGNQSSFPVSGDISRSGSSHQL